MSSLLEDVGHDEREEKRHEKLVERGRERGGNSDRGRSGVECGRRRSGLRRSVAGRIDLALIIHVVAEVSVAGKIFNYS